MCRCQVLAAHDKDEQLDVNKAPFTGALPHNVTSCIMCAEDGIRDVEAMSSQELVEHKSKLVLTSLKLKACACST